jgi:hypothetical protein
MIVPFTKISEELLLPQPRTHLFCDVADRSIGRPFIELLQPDQISTTFDWFFDRFRSFLVVLLERDSETFCGLDING